MATYLAKLGELTLKGTNIKFFERQLFRNAQSYFEESDEVEIELRAGRMYFSGDDALAAKIEFCLEHLIGITGFAKCEVCEKNIDAIKKTVFELCEKAAKNGAKTFKCDTRRADKNFPLTSYEISKETAADVFDKKILAVDVHSPDVTIFIEVRESVFVYTAASKNAGDSILKISNSKKALRGLPVGVSGKGLALLSGGIDSPVAAFRMMKRGMKIDCVYFHSYPYTSDEAQKKVEDLAATISKFGISVHLHIVSFTEAQMKIKQTSPENFSTLLLRMCMMRVANLIAERIGAQCIVTGESLGQVASQTIENMRVTESMAEFPLFRPLCAMDKEEITLEAQRIGTYETSILPYEDCCVLFSPKHPVLRASVDEAKKIFFAMQIEPLLQKSYDEHTVKNFRLGKEILPE